MNLRCATGGPCDCDCNCNCGLRSSVFDPSLSLCSPQRASSITPYLSERGRPGAAGVSGRRRGAQGFGAARAARLVNTSGTHCLSAANAVSAASWVPAPKPEHRRAVRAAGADRRTPNPSGPGPAALSHPCRRIGTQHRGIKAPRAEAVEAPARRGSDAPCFSAAAATKRAARSHQTWPCRCHPGQNRRTSACSRPCPAPG